MFENIGTIAFLKVAAVAGLALVASVGAGLSQESDAGKSPENAWVVNCASSGASNKLTCQMTQNLTQKETGKRVLTATIRRQDEGKDGLVLLLALPHGLMLPAGTAFQIDSGEQTSLPIRTSDANGVYAATPIEPALLAAMKAGQTMKVGMRTVNGKDISIPLSLAGFTASVDKLLSTN